MNDLAAEATLHQAIIRKVPIFAGLTPAEAEMLYDAAEVIRAAAGEVVIKEGEPGEAMFIVLAGELEVIKRDGDRDILLATRHAGEFFGEMSLLEKVPRNATVRAASDSQLIAIGAEAFRKLLEESPEAVTAVLGTVTGRLRSTESLLLQSDKLASLGTLAAGLAHELNNPAAAIQRSTEHLSEAYESWRRRTVELNRLELSPGERTSLVSLEASVAECQKAGAVSDVAARKAETLLLDRLEDLGVGEAWEIAPAMAAYGWTLERLEPLVAIFAPPHLDPVLQWLGAGLNAQQLVEEIRRSSRAISDIVRAVKSYSYLDQAPVQDVDIGTSLDDTLMILNHKLKHGIEVVRAIEPGLPRIEAYAGEVNQVWTNIIDNAIQAMDGNGRLEIAARRAGEEVEVVIADSGPGIPPEVAARIFEPFFTTKAQGVGTGLGLHIAHNIVVNRHRGRIEFTSVPGRTEFRIVLPMTLTKEVRK